MAQQKWSYALLFEAILELLTVNLEDFPCHFLVALVMGENFLFKNSLTLVFALRRGLRARRIWGFYPILGFYFGSNKPRLYIYVMLENAVMAAMVGDNTREFKRRLRRNEEIAQANNSAILVITSKVVELDQSNISHNANLSIILLN